MATRSIDRRIGFAEDFEAIPRKAAVLRPAHARRDIEHRRQQPRPGPAWRNDLRPSDPTHSAGEGGHVHVVVTGEKQPAHRRALEGRLLTHGSPARVRAGARWALTRTALRRGASRRGVRGRSPGRPGVPTRGVADSSSCCLPFSSVASRRPAWHAAPTDCPSAARASGGPMSCHQPDSPAPRLPPGPRFRGDRRAASPHRRPVLRFQAAEGGPDIPVDRRAGPPLASRPPSP